MTKQDKKRRLNWSSLKHIHRSPLYYQHRIDHPEPQKQSFLFGSGVHCLVLEPEKFDERYAECELTRNKRHKAFQEWLSEHPGAVPLKPQEMADMRACAESVLSHRVASEVLRGGRHEEEIQWTDPDTGFECRGRIDSIRTCVTDLKTGRDPSPRVFAVAASKYLYHGQIAFYHFGATAARLINGKEMPYIIAVESSPPWDVAVYRIKPEDLWAGRQLCLDLMKRLEECIATDFWPGVAPDLQYLDLPRWAPGLQQSDDEEW